MGSVTRFPWISSFVVRAVTSIDTASTLGSTKFPVVGMSSGLAIHEREREEERRRRAKLARQSSSTADIPLFEEPRRVQPSTEDVLQQRIQATLGTYESVVTVFQNQNHLYGIPRLPQTPVEGGDRKFDFESKKKDSRSMSDLKKAAKTAALSRFQKLSQQNGIKNQKVNGVLSSSGQDKVKSPLVIKSQEISPAPKSSTLLQRKSPPLAELSKSDKKTELKPAVNGAPKSLQGEEKVRDMTKVKTKEEKEDRGKVKNETESSEVPKGIAAKSSTITNKSKPPKILLPDRNISTASAEDKCSANEPTKVERIIAEMQQVAPPLTGIHTPIKGGSSIFAFGYRNSTPENTALPKRKNSESTEIKKENGNGVGLLKDDLLLSDDENDPHVVSPNKTLKNVHDHSHSTSSSGSSSEDSDSDSSDSDSDSSVSDSNNNSKSTKSPLQSPSSSSKQPSGRSWGLTHFVDALNQSSVPPTTKTKPSPSAANSVGEDGIRGNQVAPAANINKSSLNSHVSSQVIATDNKRAKSPMVTPLDDDFVPFAKDLLSRSPVLDQGLDIEALTAKLDQPQEGDTKTADNPMGQNGLVLKIPRSKGDKKSKSISSESKSKPGDKKSLTAKKALKSSKKEPKTPKNSTTGKVAGVKGDSSASSTSKSSKMESGVTKVKSSKKKAEITSIVSVAAAKSEQDKEMDEEDVIVDIVGENSPAKVESKPPSVSKVKEKEKAKSTKNKPAVTNDLSKAIDGEKLVSGLISPNVTKDFLGENVEITYDEVNKPESLIVKIDLSLLRRIPRFSVNGVSKQEQDITTPVREINGLKDVISSPEKKIPKRKLSDAKSMEVEVPKKVKSENDVDSCQAKLNDSFSSTSSKSDRHEKESNRKRSPSLEKDSYRSKRKRDDIENSKGQESALEGTLNGSCQVAENGVHSNTMVNGLGPHQCSCSAKGAEKKRDASKREANIARFYDPEPRVPYGPDHYLAEAKKLKHKADSSADKEEKAFFYIEAVLYFARCGKAIEQNDEECRSAFQMYSETLDLLRFTMRNFVNKYTHKSLKVPDKRLCALCMRIQSLLFMRLYKLKKDHIMRNVKMVTEHFRGPPKSTQAPSPYTSNAKITGTPSPLSPTPSPSGSIGSVGSNGSNETTTTPSRNGGKATSATNAMTSPVNVCIPQKIHSMTQQHVVHVNNLLYSQDTWDQAQPVVLEFKDFFMDLDRACGSLTLHSSIVHMIEYIEEGVKRLREALKAKNF